ncbi:hypothetical protein WJX79_003880 [Trebouxia sp. C0005]
MVKAVCDVCQHAEGSVYCFQESAVMCRDCDHRVHSASKIARTHERVSLTDESETSMCDICQDAPAVLFCCEDRAVICRECDLMIHTANEFTAKHNRHILFQVAAGLKALPPPGPGRPEDTSQMGSDNASAATQLDKGKQIQQHQMPSITTRHGGRRRPPHQQGQGQGQAHATASMQHQASLSRLESNNLIDSSNMNVNGAALLTGLEPPAVSASPFANQAMGSMSDLPSTSGANAASMSGMPQRYSNTDFGQDINLWYQPSSDAVTRAGDVLGMPHLDGYTAKDIDVAYATDPAIFDDFEADLTSLLEVPDLDFSSSQDFPRATYRDSAFASTSAAAGPSYAPSANLAGDAEVPDFEPDIKRQRK